MKTIVLYDVNQHGHHPTYCRLITKFYLELGIRVWLFCPNSHDVKNWIDRNVKFQPGMLCTHTIKKCNIMFPLSIFLYSPINWIMAKINVRSMIQKEKYSPDLIFFLKIEDFNKGIIPGKLIDFLFPHPWIGLYIHLKFPQISMLPFLSKYFIQPFSIFSAKTCQSVLSFQEDLIDQLKKYIHKPCYLFPDFTDESLPQKSKLTDQILNLSKGRKIVALVGGQDKRKGSFTFLKIARRLKGHDLFFIIVGNMNYSRKDLDLESLKQSIGPPDDWKNCFFHFEIVPDEAEFNNLFVISDIIYAVYHNFKCSSNILTKASLFKKPVIVSSGTLMGQRVEKYRLGRTCNEHSIDDIISTLLEIGKGIDDRPEYASYFKNHSRARVVETLKQIVDRLHDTMQI